MGRFEFERLAILDVVLVKPKVFGDERGFFCETYRENEFREFGIKETFVQDNHSRSGSKILRGIHFQLNGQAKLVRAASGRIGFRYCSRSVNESPSWHCPPRRPEANLPVHGLCSGPIAELCCSLHCGGDGRSILGLSLHGSISRERNTGGRGTGF